MQGRPSTFRIGAVASFRIAAVARPSVRLGAQIRKEEGDLGEKLPRTLGAKQGPEDFLQRAQEIQVVVVSPQRSVQRALNRSSGLGPRASLVDEGDDDCVAHAVAEGAN
nr:unnamed protein product [Digitaria exilis]